MGTCCEPTFPSPSRRPMSDARRRGPCLQENLVTTASLHAKHLKLTLGRTVVFDDTELQLAAGWRVGLVGPNGVGKSTLLRVLRRPAAASTRARSSRIAGRRHRRLPAAGTRPQRDETVLEFLGRRTGVTAAIAELEAATDGARRRRRPAPTTATATRSTAGSHLGGADLDARVGDRCGPTSGSRSACSSQTMPTLSGGEAARVGLAALLLARFDVFLLDEPTNDLDLDGLARLERWVVGELVAGCVIVSHDRDVPAAHRHPRRRARRVHATAPLVRRRLGRLPRRARGGAAHQAQRGLRGVRREARVPRRPRPARTRVGHAGPAAGRRRSPTTTTRTSRRSRSTRASSWPARPPAPRRRWSASTWWRSPARHGSCGSPSARRRAAATSWRGSPRRGAAAATFTLGPVDLHDRCGRAGRRSWAPTAAARPRCSTRSSGDAPLDVGRAVVRPGCGGGRARAGGASSSPDDDIGARRVHGRHRHDRCPRRGRCWPSSASVPNEVNRPTASLSPGERTRTVLALLMAKGTNCLVLDEPTNHLDLPGDRAARAGARGLRRHGAARHPRPRPARPRAPHPHRAARSGPHRRATGRPAEAWPPRSAAGHVHEAAHSPAMSGPAGW